MMWFRRRLSASEEESSTSTLHGRPRGSERAKKSVGRKSASGESSPTSSSSSSSLSLYTSESYDEDPDNDDRRSTTSSSWSLTASTTTTPCSLPFDEQPAETVVGLPADYLSKYSSLQDWLTRRKSLRNAMGTKGDFARWLRNKKKRTPLEERVLLAFSNQENNNVQTSGGVEAVKRGGAVASKHSAGASSRSRSDATEHRHSATGSSRGRSNAAADVGKDLSQSRTSSHQILTPTDNLTSHEVGAGDMRFTMRPHATHDVVGLQSESQDSPHRTSKSSGESPPSVDLVSALDAYLTQRRITLLDLFRCVDASRRGACSRRDLRYVLAQANVPLTPADVERLADWLSVDAHPDCVNYARLAPAMNRDAETRLLRTPRAEHSHVNQTTGSSSQSLLNRDAVRDAAAAACAEVRGHESEACEDRKRSYCLRVLELFRDNALFGDAVKTSSSSARRDVVGQLRSTMDADRQLAARLEEVRLRDRIEYEASRDAVRRHRLPVSGRALRRGLLAAADRPISAIDPRRLPAAHRLDATQAANASKYVTNATDAGNVRKHVCNERENSTRQTQRPERRGRSVSE